MKYSEMTEEQAVKFLERKEGESGTDYLSRTHDVYYERAYARLADTQRVLRELRESLSKMMEKAQD